MKLLVAPCKLCLAVSTLLLAGCISFGDGHSEHIGTTLADLQPARLPELQVEVPTVSLEEIEASYHRALALAEDETVRRKILIRLAGLEMIRSEQRAVSAEQSDTFFSQAVSMYQELIDLQQGQPGRDHLLYQLAKAYALDGRSAESSRVLDQLAREYPNSPHAAEAQFRRAERAFAEADYGAAQNYYAAVLQAGDTPFSENARYMQGWAQFKLSQYPQALLTFTQVLDGVAAEQPDLARVEGAQQSLVEDTLRVMSLVFSYLDGPDSIASTYSEVGPRSYIYLLYERLGDLYLEKKRFLDSAKTFAHFVEHHPNSDYAPGFSVRQIAVYDQGDFPSQLLPAKEEFVTRYGIQSSYWAQKPASSRDYLRPYLHDYLQELAGYSHSRAQAEDGSQSHEHYRRAAQWYEQFVQTFPADEKTAQVLFLLGEVYNESGQLARAVNAYERVAYELADPLNGAEAGYAAILALGNLLAAAAAESQPQWQQHLVNSQLNFADYYPDDARAAPVLARAAQSLLNSGDLLPAVAAAQRLTQWQPEPDQGLLCTAWLVIGQAQFDLESFAEAEQAYRQVLALLPANATGLANGPSRQQLIERIAASMYKQAEQQLAAGDKASAIDTLIAVGQFAPGSDIAIRADYDAATYLMDLEQWQRAAQQLRVFRQTYGEHALAASLPAKLVVVYQALEDWQAAAAELRLMAEQDSDPEVRRQSLIMAAELFERSGELGQAILAYRAYANSYSQPFSETLEAANKLVELYGKSGDESRRDFWLNKLISLDANAGDDRSERSRYLAAGAASEFADRRYQHFVSLPLNLPLNRSLNRKREALEETLIAYDKVLGYDIAEFTTLASHRLGDVYVQLSRALMESERPADLDELALEQYEILLEEQAYPFEERAIEILEANVRRSWDGLYDDWVKESFERLAALLPARYQKQEQVVEVSRAIQ